MYKIFLFTAWSIIILLLWSNQAIAQMLLPFAPNAYTEWIYDAEDIKSPLSISGRIDLAYNLKSLKPLYLRDFTEPYEKREIDVNLDFRYRTGGGYFNEFVFSPRWQGYSQDHWTAIEKQRTTLLGSIKLVSRLYLVVGWRKTEEVGNHNTIPDSDPHRKEALYLYRRWLGFLWRSPLLKSESGLTSQITFYLDAAKVPGAHGTDNRIYTNEPVYVRDAANPYTGWMGGLSIAFIHKKLQFDFAFVKIHKCALIIPVYVIGQTPYDPPESLTYGGQISCLFNRVRMGIQEFSQYDIHHQSIKDPDMDSAGKGYVAHGVSYQGIFITIPLEILK